MHSFIALIKGKMARHLPGRRTTYGSRGAGSPAKSQWLLCVASIAAILVACSVPTSKTATRVVRITNFNQGLMHQGADGKWLIYETGNKFPYEVNGGCMVNHAQHQCMWRGFEFQFNAQDVQTELSCTTQKGVESREANPNFVAGNSSKSVQWSITLNGRSGKYQDPQYIIMSKARREDDTDSTTCTFEGKTVLQFTSTILAGKPDTDATP